MKISAKTNRFLPDRRYHHHPHHRHHRHRSIVSLVLALGLISCVSDVSPVPATSDTPKFKLATEPLDLNTARKTSTEFAEGPGRLMTIVQCTGCHSGALVRQYRSTRDGWQNLIRWMQEKQGLWALDPGIENEILEYLSTQYGRSADADDRRRPAIPDALMPPPEPHATAHQPEIESQ